MKINKAAWYNRLGEYWDTGSDSPPRNLWEYIIFVSNGMFVTAMATIVICSLAWLASNILVYTLLAAFSPLLFGVFIPNNWAFFGLIGLILASAFGLRNYLMTVKVE